MSSGRIAIGFSNCLGNFVLMTSALKLLRERNDDKIYLITDKDALYKHPSMAAMAERLFDGIYTSYKPNSFDKVYVGDWSCPECLVKAGLATQGAVWWINHSPYAGMHEVQIYLNMINASNADFSGFLTVVSDKPVLKSNKIKVALANSSSRLGSRKGGKTGWAKFPDLSKKLVSLGYEVILVGQGGELDGCEGKSFIDQLNIFETSKVTSQCDFMICVDTGLMHIADSLGVPIILLAGPTPMTKARPLVSKCHIIRKFISCAPCYQSILWSTCNNALCMNAITVEDVLKVVFKNYPVPKDGLKKLSLPFVDRAPSISSKSGKTLKIVMPYYAGNTLIDDAIKSWPKDVIVLATTDENIKVPDGYEFFYTPDNAKIRGLSNKTKPITKDLFNRLLQFYPNMDFYGYANSDIILPPDTDVRSLLPGYGYQAALHHRLAVHDLTNSRKSDVSYWSGKDCFIWSSDIFKNVVGGYPELVLGACSWDDGLALWMWREFGENCVDVRYGEVWHVNHSDSWANSDFDGVYNSEQLEAIGISKHLRSQYPWRQRYQDWVMIRNKIGIVQPGRIGDLIIVLPIAKWYADKGYEVVWPVCNKYLPLFKYVNYVNAIGTGTDIDRGYKKAVEMLNGKVGKVINLGIGFGRDEQDWLESGLTFDQWKYEEACVPFAEKHKLQITRNIVKEDALKKELNLPDRYIITHSKGESAGSCTFDIPNAVEVRPVDGYCLFDWIGILKSAEELHCINSSVMNLVEGLKIGKSKRHVKLWKLNCDPERAKLLVPKIGLDWYSQKSGLLVSFFTIVYNGMPFIERHLDRFNQMPFPWHWHIVEGLAHVAGDSGSEGHKARGGHIPSNAKSFLSTDGTTEYLDKLAALPNVTIHRPKEIWASKLDMINTPLAFIDYKCVLWEIDVDEFYPLSSMIELHKIFEANHNKTVAVLPHIDFLGKTKYVIHNGEGWGSQSFPRLWAYEPGCQWKSHEPPVLINKNARSLLKLNPFKLEDVAHLGYHHYNYVLPEQVRFKEVYYGYKDLYAGWLKMQSISGKVHVYDFFKFEDTKNVFADDWDVEYLTSLE